MCGGFKKSNFDPGGFSEFLRLGPEHLANTVLPIPKGLGSLAATLTEPLACCVRNLRRLGLGPGDAAGVVGLGSVGLLTGQLLKARGIRALGFDLDPGRRGVAESLGLITASWDEGAQAARLLSEGRGLDALIFTAGGSRMLSEGLALLRDGGSLSLFAELPGGPPPLDPAALYHREISVIPSYSSSPADLKEALDLIASGAVAASPLTGHVFSLDRFDEAVRRTRSRDILKAIFVMRDEMT